MSSRRSFIGYSFGAVAGVGALFALGAVKKSADPLPSGEKSRFLS